jgi:CubicO group peptidase (beta-lactamase class C family)
MRYIILALLLAIHPSLSAEQKPPPTSTESHDAAAFLQHLDSLREDANIPGLSVVVVKDHAIVLAAGLGYADVENGIPATAETPYDIASVAKPLSAVVALRLVETAALDLDRRLVDYSDWADFCTKFSRQASIFAQELRCQPPDHTLRHLLSHTAAGTPGSRFSYNPILYSWASRPMMAVTDSAFSVLVERYVFIPAGMKNSARKPLSFWRTVKASGGAIHWIGQRSSALSSLRHFFPRSSIADG